MVRSDQSGSVAEASLSGGPGNLSSGVAEDRVGGVRDSSRCRVVAEVVLAAPYLAPDAPRGLQAGDRVAVPKDEPEAVAGFAVWRAGKSDGAALKRIVEAVEPGFAVLAAVAAGVFDRVAALPALGSTVGLGEDVGDHSVDRGGGSSCWGRLGLGGALTDHGSIVGAGTEHGWYGYLTGFLPKRYRLASGKVVDCKQQQSEQVDLIVYDSFYSPLLFTVGDSTLAPAESVYAAFEVKQALDKVHLAAAAQKAKSVRRLHRTSALIPNQFGKEIRKNLDDLPILAGILASARDWKVPYNEVLSTHLGALDVRDAIDFGCALGAGAFDTKRAPVAEGRALLDVSVSVPDRTLSYFTMLLLHRLQQLGTVGAIDYEAYAEPLTYEA